MNKPINRLFGVSLILFALLVGATSWWTVLRSDKLDHDYPTENRRALVRGLTVKRGAIRADDGSVLARSIKRADGTYTRRYPSGDLFGEVLGYSYLKRNQTGIEQTYDDDLRGKRNDAETIVDELRGAKDQGDRLQTTLDPKAQKIAMQGLAGRRGAVVALDPRSGAIKAMATVPTYDPQDIADDVDYAKIQRDPADVLVNRATQGAYPPGSTFKVVSTIAALDSGKFTPDSVLSGKSPITVSTKPLANDEGESFGDVTLTKALTLSINTVYAQVALRIGGGTLQKYMSRLGFGKTLPLDYPDDQIRKSGETLPSGRLVKATSPRVDLGRLGIGQDKLLVSPMQMAMVAAAVANGGKLMKPHFGDKIVDSDGRTKKTIEPEQYSRVMSKKTASELTDMMSKVVEEGTGQSVNLPGVAIAGKTGTAQKGAIGSNITQPWFIAFAPRNDPKVAVAATVETSNGGFGATVAAPIAKSVIQTLLNEEGGG